MYSILFFLIMFLSILLIKLLKPKANTLLTIALTIAIVYFLAKPQLCIQSATDGAKLFVKAILPTMFPFMVICNMIINLDGIKIYSKVLGPLICKPLNLSYPCSFALVASILCGYPLGAKYSTELYKNKMISHKEFIRLLSIASNIGPLFLIGAVGTSMLGNTSLGYLLLIPSYLSCLIIGILTKSKKEEPKLPPNNSFNMTKSTNLGEVIRTSIQDASINVLVLCGYVIVFSVIINMVKEVFIPTSFILKACENLNIPSTILTGTLLGSIEATNGCNIISSSNLNILFKLCLLSFLCSFGGLSIIAQTTAFFYTENVPIFKYFSLKLLQGMISFIIMFFTYTFLKDSIVASSTLAINYIFATPVLLLLFLSIIVFIIYKMVLTS